MKFTSRQRWPRWCCSPGRDPRRWPNRHLADDHDGIVVRFDFSDPELQEVETEDGTFLRPRVAGDTPLLRAGAPDLSKVDATLMIGAQTGTALEVIDAEYVEFNDVAVVPSKGNLYRNVDPADVPFEQGALYTQDAFYPATPAAIQTPFVQRESVASALGVPLPVQRRDRRAARPHVHHRPHRRDGRRAGESGGGPGAGHPEFADQLSRRFLNAASAEERYDYIEEHGKYVVVTDAMYDDVLAPLVQWKIEKGIPTEVVYAADFGMDFDAIRDYLADQYFNEGMTHVILAGDEDQVPSELVTNGGGTGYCDPALLRGGQRPLSEFFVAV